MECFIVQPSDVDAARRELTLRGEEVHHALRSLRLHVGDELLATDLIGTCYRARIAQASGEIVSCNIDEVLPNFGESSQDVLLIASLLSQPARWEFLLEKATELGVRAIQPIHTERTERLQFRRERSEKILRAAVKQTKRARMPEMKDAIQLPDAIAMAQDEGRNIFLLHESASKEDSLARRISDARGLPIAIIVGPEGGFSEEEVEMAREKFGACLVSLGSRRLRAETAAIAALAIAHAQSFSP